MSNESDNGLRTWLLAGLGMILLAYFGWLGIAVTGLQESVARLDAETTMMIHQARHSQDGLVRDP